MEQQFVSMNEIDEQIEAIGEKIALLTQAPKAGIFYDALTTLLERQDRKTCAEVDSAACGRTSADRRREAQARLAFEKELLSFLQRFIPK